LPVRLRAQAVQFALLLTTNLGARAVTFGAEKSCACRPVAPPHARS
jgi:hypothetical protein